MAVHVLDLEQRTFARWREELCATAPGQYVFIQGEKVYGPYPSQNDAVKNGYHELKTPQFLVKRIAARDVPCVNDFGRECPGLVFGDYAVLWPD